MTGETDRMYGEIFINYRGPDSRSYAALLYMELSRRFGPERVFLDSESIPAGADYAEQLLARVRHARAVLAVIGPHWLSLGSGRRRRIKETDWTRRELVEAFAAGTKVIPVLADETDLPTGRQLPDCLAPLTRCQYRRLRCRDASADLDRIVKDLASADPELALAVQRQHTAPLPVLLDPSDQERPPESHSRAAATVLARRLAIAAGRAAAARRDAGEALPHGRAGDVTLYRSLVAGRRRARWYDDDPRRAEQPLEPGCDL